MNVNHKRQYISVENGSGGQLLIRELVDGVEKRYKEKFKPTLYISTQKQTKYKNFYQTGYVEPVKFSSSYEMRKYVEEKKVIDHFLWGSNELIYQFIHEQNYNCQDFSNIDVSFLDIEVCTRFKDNQNNWIDGGFPSADEARFPINAICDYRSNDKKYHVFTTAPGWSKEVSQLKYKDQVDYVYCETEEELLQNWMTFWTDNYPHILTGWNSSTFDIPYIVNRVTNLSDESIAAKLSPWDKVESKVKKNGFNQQNTYKICGIACLDYLDLYKKYRYKTREKYTLQFISSIENPNDHKLEFEESTHGELYYKDPVHFVDYNIQDVRCVVCFERDLQFINLACFIAYYAGVNFADNMSPVRVWENLIYNESLNKNIVVPIKLGGGVDSQKFEGAYVHEVTPGLKGAIISLDFSSLYPNIMRSWYIAPDVHMTGGKKTALYNGLIEVLKKDHSEEAHQMLYEIMTTGIFVNFYIDHDMPESVTKYLHDNQVTLTTNCEFFSIKNKSIVIDLITDLFTKRKADKKESFRQAHIAQDIAKELEKRGVAVEHE